MPCPCFTAAAPVWRAWKCCGVAAPAKGKGLRLRHNWAMAPAPGRPRGGGGSRSTSYKPGTRSCAEPQFSLLCAFLYLKGFARDSGGLVQRDLDLAALFGDSGRQIALSGLEIGLGEVLVWHRMWQHPDYEARMSASLSRPRSRPFWLLHATFLLHVVLHWLMLPHGALASLRGWRVATS